MSVKKILISQQQPSLSSPYEDVIKKYGVRVDFTPFYKMEALSSREFRAQKIEILDFTAIVFSARTTIDAFFRICEEMRIKIPDTMKYFCTSEVVANYLQKYIVYRKRKIFFGDGTPNSIMGLIGTKHKDEKFLIATSASMFKDAITTQFEKSSFVFTTAEFVKSVSQDIKGIDLHSYDIVVVLNPNDVKSIFENCPDFEQKNLKFISYGRSIVRAMEEANLKIELQAPTPEIPSVAMALEQYLENNK